MITCALRNLEIFTNSGFVHAKVAAHAKSKVLQIFITCFTSEFSISTRKAAI